MTDILRRHSRSQPGVIAWTVATCSLGLSVAAAWYGINFSENVRQNIVRDRLEKSISAKNYAQTEEIMRGALKSPQILRWISTARGENIKTKKSRETVALNLLSALRALHEEHAQEARNLYRQIGAGDMLAMLPEEFFDQGGTNFTERISSNLERLVRFEDKKKLFDEAEKKSNAERNKLLDDYQQVKREFADLMGLSLFDDEKNFKFYKDGVLKELPVLTDLPDNISTLDELKSVLYRAGGRVRIEGANPHEIFMQRITDYRDSSLAIVYELNRIQDRMKDVKKEYKRLLPVATTAREAAFLDLQELLTVVSVESI